MKAFRIILSIFVFWYSSFVYAQDVATCKQDEGNHNVSIGNYPQGFKLLQTCESLDGASGLTLGQLAILYLYHGYGNFASIEARIQKGFELLTRSAMKGNADALRGVVSVYKYGDKVLNIEPEPTKVACIERLLIEQTFNEQSKVEKCLKSH